MLDPRFKTLFDRVAEDKLEEVCDSLILIAMPIGPPYSNRAMTTRGQLAAVARDFQEGILEAAQARVERNKIRLSILSQIRELEARTAITSEGPSIVVEESTTASPDWVEHGAALAKAVCRVLADGYVGTGFLIEGDRVLTCHHTLPSMQAADKATVTFDDNARYKYGVIPSSWRGSAELDAAVVTLQESAKQPLSRWGYLELERGRTPRDGDKVMFVAHPDGTAKVMTTKPGRVVRAHGHDLYYTLGTVPGVSGAPIFNEDWRVIAVHGTGGHRMKELSSGDTMLANKGVLISSIRDELLKGHS